MRRPNPLVLLAVAALALAGCGGDDDGAGDSPGTTAAAPADGGGSSPADPGDGEADDSGTGDGVQAGEPGTGTFTIDGTTYELALGDQPTAMCTVVDGDEGDRPDGATIMFMEAADAGRIDASYQSDPAELAAITWYDASGNRTWLTGNADEAEGLDPAIEISGSTLVVEGEWIDVAGDGGTAEGRLQITC